MIARFTAARHTFFPAAPADRAAVFPRSPPAAAVPAAESPTVPYQCSAPTCDDSASATGNAVSAGGWNRTTP